MVIECNVYYSDLIICNTKSEVLEIYRKIHGQEDEDQVYGAIKMEPYTINNFLNQKEKNRIKNKK